jgi:CubicO group peptidase (beta-lactamase class C family)
LPNGILAAACAAADRTIRTTPELSHVRILLVAHGGTTVYEQAYAGWSPDAPADIHSVTKSVVSTVVGLLVADGTLALDTTVGDLLADHLDPVDRRRAAISVRHLLTMTSGLDADTPWDIDEIHARGEPWVAGVLRSPLVTEPGTAFAYNNGASHLLSAMVQAATGRRLDAVATERLLTPLGVLPGRWPTDPQGLSLAYGHLQLRPRDLLRLGLLFAHDGRLDPDQLVDAAWVRAATRRQVDGSFPEQTGYGFLWWVDTVGDRPAFFAGGHGGQYVLVVPSLDLVVVTVGDADALPADAGSPRVVATELARSLT